MKNGSSKEVDITNQHLRVLKAMKQDSINSLATAIIKAKMDTNTMKEWQKQSWDQMETPSYTQILKFLDLQARDTENIVHDNVRKWLVTKTYTTSIKEDCVACRMKNHPLYSCKVYKIFLLARN